MQPGIEFESAENPDQDDHEHLECHTGVPCVNIKLSLLLVEVHLVSVESEAY